MVGIYGKLQLMFYGKFVRNLRMNEKFHIAYKYNKLSNIRKEISINIEIGRNLSMTYIL